MQITSASQLLELCGERNQSLSHVVAEYEAFRAGTTVQAVRERMGRPSRSCGRRWKKAGKIRASSAA